MDSIKKYEDDYRRANDSIVPAQSTKNAARCAMSEKKGRTFTLSLSHAVAAALACILIVTTLIYGFPNVVIDGAKLKTPNSVKSVSTYDDVYSRLSAYYESNKGHFWDGFGMSKDLAVGEGVPENEAAMPQAQAAPSDNATSDYSKTNTQEQGVDEADIIKTDGRHIYVLSNGLKLSIISADGKNTKLISSINLYEATEPTEDSTDSNYAPDYAADAYNIQGMYVYDDTVVVIATKYTYSMVDSYYNAMQATQIMLIDVSDATKPVQTKCIAQDGYYKDSRMKDSVLYTVSTQFPYDLDKIDKNDPTTFIPGYCVNDSDKQIVPEDSIVFFDDNNCTNTVMTTVDVGSASPAVTSSLVLIGNVDGIYASTNNIYAYSSDNDIDTTLGYYNRDTEKFLPISEVDENNIPDSYIKMAKEHSVAVTVLYRVSMENGKLSYCAKSRVSGSINNQFSLSEHRGYLRLVTTCTESTYVTSVASESNLKDYYYYYPITDVMKNALYVLDGELNTVGKITDLAEDERIYSARFMGDICYFVTFRNVDPLFSVDLSDPTAPYLLGALKIPGFSDYLHPYGDGLLFGLGMAADEKTGRTECLKLSMFDISEPKNVTECACEKLPDIYFSEASYNHKAILVDSEKNIIAFPNERGYSIYSYAADKGFIHTATVSFDNEYFWSAMSRGLYINDYFYVIDSESCELIVLDMNNFKLVTSKNFS